MKLLNEKIDNIQSIQLQQWFQLADYVKSLKDLHPTGLVYPKNTSNK